VRGIKETGGLTEKLDITSFPWRLRTKQIEGEGSVYTLMLQAKLVGRRKLRKLFGRESDSSDGGKDRLQQFRVPACFRQSLGYPQEIVLEHDGKLRAALESPNYLAIHLCESLGKGLCLARCERISREETSVAAEEFLVCRGAGSHGEVPGFLEEFNRISVLPRQG
jgi:hypothetical protein